jgi:hypothetical protein
MGAQDPHPTYNGAAFKGGTMFGLPVGTTLLIFGFPVFWILYTIGFLVVSKHWKDEGDQS